MEKAAFDVCESDGAEGLTWDEVEECEVRFLKTLLGIFYHYILPGKVC